MASQQDVTNILLGSLLVSMWLFGFVVYLVCRQQARGDAKVEALASDFYRHTHSLYSGRVHVPSARHAMPPPAPPSSGPVRVVSTREAVDPLAATVVAVASSDDTRDTLVELATTLPSAGEVAR